LDLLIPWNLSLENEGKNWLSSIAKGLFSLAKSLSLRGWSGGKFMVVLIILQQRCGGLDQDAQSMVA